MLPLFAIAVASSPPVVAPLSIARGENPSRCLPAEVLRGATVVALGTYRGDGPTLPFKLAGSPYALQSLTVTGRTVGPVVLVMAAYEPVLWDLSAIKGQVKAVVASGYYPQAVTGVSAETPVRFSSSVNSASGVVTCGRIHYADNDLPEIQRMAADTQRTIGVHPRLFYGSYSTGRLHLGGSASQAAQPLIPPDLRTAVPIITEDDPNRRSLMSELPEADERPIRFVEWDKRGKVVRDEGGPSPPRVNTPSPPRADTSSIGWTVFGFLLRCLFWLGPIALVIVRWPHIKRLLAGVKPLDTSDRSLQPPIALPERRPAAIRSSSTDRRLVTLARIAALSESDRLVMALHRYGRELRSVMRLTFDEDMAEEVAAIVDRHFDHAVDRYGEKRSSLEGLEAERADDTLTHAVERLTERLVELRGIQHGRDLAGMDEAARFVDMRHPA